MSSFRIVQATDADAKALAWAMRAEDRAEVAAGGSPDPLHAVRESIEISHGKALAWYTPDGIGAIFGVVPMGLLSRRGVVWCLTSFHVEKYPVAYVKECKHQVARMREEYDCLINWTDRRYTRALAWAKRLGFEVGQPERIDGFAVPFCRITLGG